MKTHKDYLKQEKQQKALCNFLEGLSIYIKEQEVKRERDRGIKSKKGKWIEEQEAKKGLSIIKKT